MATWKKVVVSGSSPAFSTLTLDNALGVAYGGTGTASIGLNNFLVGAGASSYTNVGSNGTGTVVRTTGASGLTHSGSFSGSFYGDGTNITGINANANISIAGASGSTGTFATGTDLLMFTTASNHGFTFQVIDATTMLVQLSTPQDLRSTANPTFGNVNVNGGSVLTNQSTFNIAPTTATTVNLGGAATTLAIGNGVTAISLSGSVNVRLAMTASTGMFTGLSAGTTNTVLILSSTNDVQTRSIDARVWGTSLIDGAGANTRVAFYTDADTISSNASFTYDGTNVTVGNSTFGTNTRIAGNLIVAGTASFENTSTLVVADRFILLNSGSATGDGGIVIQSGSQMSGSAFVFGGTSGRFGYQIATPLSAGASSATIDAFACAIVDIDNGLTDIATYQKNGNIKVSGSDIYIWS
jgi:hypothetical protein